MIRFYSLFVSCNFFFFQKKKKLELLCRKKNILRNSTLHLVEICSVYIFIYLLRFYTLPEMFFYLFSFTKAVLFYKHVYTIIWIVKIHQFTISYQDGAQVIYCMTWQVEFILFCLLFLLLCFNQLYLFWKHLKIHFVSWIYKPYWWKMHFVNLCYSYLVSFFCCCLFFFFLPSFFF